ncbi:PucR family transcriptional regulator [Streptomyces sp. NPDC002577]
MIGEAAAGWALEVARRCSDGVIATMEPDLAAHFADDTRDAIGVTVLSLLQHLVTNGEQFMLNAQQVNVAQALAREETPYEDFMTGMRLVQEICLESLLDEVMRIGPEEDRVSLVRALPSEVSHFFDFCVAGMVNEYLAERERTLAQAMTRRRQMIQALVEGQDVDEPYAGEVLGLDLGYWHLALVMRAVKRDASRARVGLERIAARAAETVGAPGLLTLPDDTRPGTLLCWLAAPQSFSAEALAGLRAYLGGNEGVAVAIGTPGRGPAGFRRTTVTARETERIGRFLGDEGVLDHPNVSVLALLSKDEQQAQWFVAEELGGLADDEDPAVVDLRQTVLSYFGHGRNLVRAAEELHVHRNTVVYRLAKAERLLGHPLDERPLELHAALMLRRHGVRPT